MLNKRGKIAISQIIILVIGIVAISYALGSEMRVVSGQSDFNLQSPPIAPKIEHSIGKTVNLNGHTWTRVKNDYWTSPTAPSGSWYDDATVNLESMKVKDANALKNAPSTTTTPGGSSTASGWLKIKDARITPDNPTGKGGFWSWQTGGLADAVISGASWGLIAYGVSKMVLPMITDDEEKAETGSEAIGFGFASGKLASVLLGKGGALEGWGYTSGWWAIGIGAVVAAWYYYEHYKEETTQTITFTCYPWEAPTKGDYCEECNNQELPCSEYQCRSLGQACELLNQGTDEEKCVWVNRNDVNPPVIKPLENALLDDYRYKLQNTGISPPAKGVIIEYIKSTDKCVPAFTPLSFGVTTDEPAKCKIDYIRKDSFDDMDFYFGGSSTSKYNHTQVMSLPGASAAETENLTIRNDGNFELYVKCQDANGNYNTADFVFKLCVDAGPDTTPPLISGTNPLNGLPIAYNQTSIDIEVYVNEPVECKWSHSDQSYDSMPDENKMDNTKADSVSDIDAQGRYTLTTTLTGLKDRQENKFYFRCKDQPSAEEEDRNVNAESYKFVLIGTQPLKIDSVGPSGIIKDSTEVVKVTLTAKTSAGYHEGEATCEFGETLDLEVDDKFTPFWTHEHSYDLWLTEGDYEYFIRCYDLGGNPDNKTINFTVETDRQEPLVVRAYRDGTYLRIITNEPAECVYDNMDCSYSFDDGIDMKVIDETNHFTEWNTEKDFYIKCRDEYGNLPDECSIIIRPFEVYKGGE